MGNLVEIKVSREVAEWLLEVVKGSHQSQDIFGLDGINTSAAVSAIETGLKFQTRRPRSCAHCGNSLYITGYGKPRKYCNDACKQAAYRDRNIAS